MKNNKFSIELLIKTEDFSLSDSDFKDPLVDSINNKDGIEIVSVYSKVINDQFVLRNGEIKKVEKTIVETDGGDDNNGVKNASSYVYKNVNATTMTMSMNIGTHSTTTMYMTTGTVYDSNNSASLGYGTKVREEKEYIEPEEVPEYREIEIKLIVKIYWEEPYLAVDFIENIITSDPTIDEVETDVNCRDTPKKDLREIMEGDMRRDIFKNRSENSKKVTVLTENLTGIKKMIVKSRRRER